MAAQLYCASAAGGLTKREHILALRAGGARALRIHYAFATGTPPDNAPEPLALRRSGGYLMLIQNSGVAVWRRKTGVSWLHGPEAVAAITEAVVGSVSRHLVGGQSKIRELHI